MPPRHTYWTIIVDGMPTAFRAAERDELLPTFERIRQKNPGAELKWFAKGRLWTSPDEARQADRPPRPDNRGRDWRPGGQHKDPRDRFKQKRKDREREPDREASDVRFGRPLTGIDLGAPGAVAVFAPSGEFLALYEQRGGVAKPVAVFV